jgi:hypothetical protein
VCLAVHSHPFRTHAFDNSLEWHGILASAFLGPIPEIDNETRRGSIWSLVKVLAVQVGTDYFEIAFIRSQHFLSLVHPEYKPLSGWLPALE